jgi:hypothetical protein
LFKREHLRSREVPVGFASNWALFDGNKDTHSRIITSYGARVIRALPTMLESEMNQNQNPNQKPGQQQQGGQQQGGQQGGQQNR